MRILLFVMIRSVVKSFKVPVGKVVVAWFNNESVLPRSTDSNKKILVDLELVLDG